MNWEMQATGTAEDDLTSEVCNGFQLLADSERGVITFHSLKHTSALLGIHSLHDDDLLDMLSLADLDGDGVLDLHEFCILMISLSNPPSIDYDDHSWPHHELGLPPLQPSGQQGGMMSAECKNDVSLLLP